ncbi:alpha/beta hydrolase [Alkalimarinus alittae]|uniref:Alpha/beta hydrolase n=1 Tax=Alkalimarinus alittae TaxID=2961619 RepID=A0ABY6N6R1_9ALTE|nr:alpha/beta hydrolase [Alkalimarinus alittae]UZE97813.1 alpha/beta hydrolase [Alkalimarinus alittae]
MKKDEFILSTDDGHSIFVRSWKPSRKKPQGIVQISHGMAEHSERYTDTAQQLCAAGFIVFAHDHRGHGQSMNGSPAGHYAKKNGWALVKSDLDLVNKHISAKHPELPLFLLGHSMGSFISMSYLIDQNPKLAGVILSGSNYDHPIRYQALKPIIKAEKLRIGAEGKSPIINFLTFGSFNKGVPNPKTKFDWLSSNTDEVKRYIDDDACGFICTNQFWDDLTDGLISISSNTQLKKIASSLPIYLFAGCNDPVGNNSKGVRRLAHKLISSNHTDVSCKLYPGGRHEMLNETNKVNVVDDLIAWLTTKS